MIPVTKAAGDSSATGFHRLTDVLAEATPGQERRLLQKIWAKDDSFLTVQPKMQSKGKRQNAKRRPKSAQNVRDTERYSSNMVAFFKEAH